MRRSNRTRALVVGLLWITTGLTGCGAGSSPRVDPGQDRPVAADLVATVPRSVLGNPVAAGDRIVDLSGEAEAFGEVVDLRTGATSKVSSPTDDGLHLLGVEADRDRVVLVGFAGGVGDEYDRIARSRVSYALDLDSLAWTELTLPSDVRDPEVDARFVAAAGGPTGIVGAFGTGGSGWVLATAGPTGWTEVGRLDGELDQWCATDRAVFTLAAVDRPERRSPDAPYPADLVLTEAPFDGGGNRTLDLPPLRADVGAAGVDLGCTAASVSLLGGSDGEPPARLFTAAADGSWATSASPSDEEGSWTNEGARSDPSGVWFGYAPFDPAAHTTGASKALRLDPKGRVTDLPPVEGRKVLWSRGTGQLLLVGPGGDDTEGEPRSDADDATVPIEVVAFDD